MRKDNNKQKRKVDRKGLKWQTMAKRSKNGQDWRMTGHLIKISKQREWRQHWNFRDIVITVYRQGQLSVIATSYEETTQTQHNRLFLIWKWRKHGNSIICESFRMCCVRVLPFPLNCYEMREYNPVRLWSSVLSPFQVNSLGDYKPFIIPCQILDYGLRLI